MRYQLRCGLPPVASARRLGAQSGRDQNARKATFSGGILAPETGFDSYSVGGQAAIAASTIRRSLSRPAPSLASVDIP